MEMPATKPSAPFVGREPELDQLNQILETVIDSQQPKFVLIAGDYGVGKTALVDHFLAGVPNKNSQIIIGRGTCSVEKESNGLIPFGQLFANLTRQDGKPFFPQEGFIKFTKEVAPAWLDIVTAGAASATVKTIEESRKLIEGSNHFSQENVFVQFTNALSRLAKKQPVIAFIDDLHWADVSSLGLLFHLVRNLPDLPVLFIATYRPVEGLETGPNSQLFREIRANLLRYSAVELEICQGLNVAKYVEQRYPKNSFPPALINRVQELTEGHALYVSQVFSLWQDKGTIKSAVDLSGQKVWFVSETSNIEFIIPPTLGEVLAERIRSMAEELRGILVYASVEGDDFTVQMIARLCQINEIKASDNLELLEHHYYLIQEKGTREIGLNVLDFYRFAHRFFREHIYNNMAGSKKRMMHKQVGECLEALYTDRIVIAGQLARHFREAMEWMKAAQYALLAAQFEQSRYVWEEGERWCKSGLELLAKVPQDDKTKQIQLDLLEQSGIGYYFWGKYSHAFEKYISALALAKQLSAYTEREAYICGRLSAICEMQGRNTEAMEYAKMGLQILSSQGATQKTDTYLELESMQAWMEYRFDNHQLAVEISRQVLADSAGLPPTLKLKKTIANSYDIIATSLCSLNQYAEALQAVEKMMEAAKDNVNEKTHAILALDASWHYFRAGKLEETMTFAAKGQEIALKIGDLDLTAFSKNMFSLVHLARSEFQEAVTGMTEAIKISEEIDALYDISNMYANRSLAECALGDLLSADQDARYAVERAEVSGSPSKIGWAYDALAQIEAAQRHWDSAEQNFMHAISQFQLAGDRQNAALAQFHNAKMLISKGAPQEAVGLLKAANSVFLELGFTKDAEMVARVLETIEE